MKFLPHSIICSLLVMGCGASSVTTQELTSETLPQSQQEYLEAVKQEHESNLKTGQSALESLNYKACDKLNDESLMKSCQYQLIMTMAAAGDKTLCSKLEDQQDRELCQQ